MYIVFIIGSERATRRNSRNSVSNRADVTIDNVLCLCNAFMAATPLEESRGNEDGGLSRRGEGNGSGSEHYRVGRARSLERDSDHFISRIVWDDSMIDRSFWTGADVPERLLVPHPQSLVSWNSPHHRTTGWITTKTLAVLRYDYKGATVGDNLGLLATILRSHGTDWRFTTS